MTEELYNKLKELDAQAAIHEKTLEQLLTQAYHMVSDNVTNLQQRSKAIDICKSPSMRTKLIGIRVIN